ncbi:hypothetical protein [Halotia branconii]|uniref:Uncharacterized protein n=1 Tax=Halotia branconii CENA392 TaxID=1539056 RepID=A0AAJ6P9Q3_9CYAN|nr:hypothetical protein [Halotia branconii]WGV25980.1 hypothetical protein QI031_00190 [Halotia branconii CENA392]
MKRYTYKGEKHDLKGFRAGQGKKLADNLSSKLPFGCKTSGNLTEEDVQRSDAIKIGMKDQAQRWHTYANNMTQAIEDVPEVIDQQNRVRGAVLDAATKIVQSTAKLDEKGAVHLGELSKTHAQVTGNVSNILLKARLAVRYVGQVVNQSGREAKTKFQLDSQLSNHKHQVNQNNARASFRERLKAVRETKQTYSLQPGDIDL